MVGAGVLGLPLVLARLGWVPGLIAIAVAWLITWYTVWLLIQLHESETGKRFDRFAELGQHAFGEYLGFWLVMPQQLIVQVGSDIVYMVTGGKSLQKCLTLITPKADLRKTYYILMFTGLQLILSQSPNFNSLKIISLTAAIMSISYSFIATGASIWKGMVEPHAISYGFRSTSTVKIVFDIFSSLGVLAFAFAGHSVALEIQATIPSSPEHPSKKPMSKGVTVAYLIVALCYFPVAISGFWAFGNAVEDDVLLSLENPNWLISVANFMVFVHVLGSYQVFAMPIFDKIESTLVTRWHFTPGRPLRLIARSAFVVLTGFLGMLLPFFGGLLGFFGGLAFSSTSYIEAQISQEKEALGNGGGGPSTSFLSVLCPLLKLFSAGDPSAERNYLVEEATSSLSTLARLPWGSRSLSDGLNNEQRADPPLPLQLYEFEACPFCRRVREAITELDLSVEIFPCPKGSVRHRALVRQLGGREQFPFLVDPNTGTSMYESTIWWKNESFIWHLGEICWLTLLTGWVPTLLRAGRGMSLWENSVKESPPRKLELFSYENNPYARIVREALCELELPYILQSVGQGSIRERLLNEKSGSKEVPYLVDHNTGMEIGDYKKIVSYLFQTYSSKSVPAYLQQ
ncbi:hypothetical protein C2S51_036323 [Perilla frutescens var. frutescens]|nr:hypothetical protein C2S51_036323 [Perilla frutescens var. frutescens]